MVSLPHSISPTYYPNDALPPRELFDLLIFDEAHHVPSRSWKAILDYFAYDHALLLTATPSRRDGQRLPGEHIYHYPLRQALRDGLYNQVRPRFLDLKAHETQDIVDQRLAEQVVQIASEDSHQTSTILIRAMTVERAETLAAIYRQRGLSVSVLHSALSARTRDLLSRRIRSGECRAVAVVNMLGEGFDLPSLRILAYHDKHRSLPATIQLIGRLVRVDERFPQSSVVVAARNTEAYPQLQRAVRELYAEDADWAEALPQFIDDEITKAKANREYAQEFAVPPPDLSVEFLTPLCRAIVLEVDPARKYQPPFIAGVIPERLRVGQRLRGQTIFYSSVNPTKTTLMLVTTAVDRPRWHARDPGLDTSTFELHLITWRAGKPGQPHLMLINSPDRAVVRELMTAVGATDVVRPADPRRMQGAFDALERRSVSSVGVRNTYQGGRGVPTYAMFAGSGVDRGLRDADTGRRALGHTLAQISSPSGIYSAGVSAANGKYWETRYVSLNEYEDFATDLASRYWHPSQSGAGPLLPHVTRGSRLEWFPNADLLLIEINPKLIGQGWTTPYGPLEDLDLGADLTYPRTDQILPIRAVRPTDPQTVLWRGYQDHDGRFHANGADVTVQLASTSISLHELLTSRPPNIYFIDGSAVHGSTFYQAREPSNDLPPLEYVTWSWANVDITSETRDTAKNKNVGRSVHEELENYLTAQPKRTQRWILCNDGKGEIADYLVIEVDPGPRVTVSLWHAKAASKNLPAVRVNDLQVVTQQAIKSRRYITDTALWTRVGARLLGDEPPKMIVVEGDPESLLALCGRRHDHAGPNFAKNAPVVQGRIGIVQPGLMMSKLRAELRTPKPNIPARQIREFLTVLHDATSSICDITLLTS
ncbi:hypothetical protein GCM10009661_44990 [Catellatospora chokoriensis]|uniref:Helicase C-terminal domain-containing protein n=1 Tax=Catellatospora chokoriensis TaxID=310353 RepID=A0A8J3JUZ5_9ACTN|nr:hypothetical protein Cch02nite_49800 [Catellatospora chokoriensis]